MKKTPNFLEDRICLNVLTNSIENAKEIYTATEGHVLLGILTINYPNDQTAIEDMKKYQAIVENAISIGLGAGNPNQSEMVTRVSAVVQPQHVNQVFTGVGQSRALLSQNETFVNGLISPTGKKGFVNISTGPLSSKKSAAEIPITSAIAILKDMGASSIKYFPMKGLGHIEEYKVIAEACAENNFALEPTGGITLANFEKIIRIPLEIGVKKVIPHVYSSIIDKETNKTKIEDVKTLYAIMKKVLEGIS